MYKISRLSQLDTNELDYIMSFFSLSGEMCMSDELAARNASSSASAAIITPYYSFTSSAVTHIHIHTN